MQHLRTAAKQRKNHHAFSRTHFMVDKIFCCPKNVQFCRCVNSWQSWIQTYFKRLCLVFHNLNKPIQNKGEFSLLVCMLSVSRYPFVSYSVMFVLTDAKRTKLLVVKTLSNWKNRNDSWLCIPDKHWIKQSFGGNSEESFSNAFSELYHKLN